MVWINGLADPNESPIHTVGESFPIDPRASIHPLPVNWISKFLASRDPFLMVMVTGMSCWYPGN